MSLVRYIISILSLSIIVLISSGLLFNDWVLSSDNFIVLISVGLVSKYYL